MCVFAFLGEVREVWSTGTSRVPDRGEGRGGREGGLN